MKQFTKVMAESISNLNMATPERLRKLNASQRAAFDLNMEIIELQMINLGTQYNNPTKETLEEARKLLSKTKEIRKLLNA
ncbi:hypothetical protein ABER75_26070 [Niallia taxi]|uniref:hypothetical protein n=1 Tax=Niallia taxi TaxID=2499688 RepID=UPI003D2D0A8B